LGRTRLKAGFQVVEPIATAFGPDNPTGICTVPMNPPGDQTAYGIVDQIGYPSSLHSHSCDTDGDV